MVYRFLLSAVGPGDVDDCFQETFLAALRAYPNLEDARNLRGWVLAIATRKAIDNGRARARRPVPVAEVPEPAASDGPVEAALAPFDPVWDAVRSLPARQRVALVHRVVLDRTYEQMAADLGGSAEAARANVYQALKKLRNGMGVIER